MTAARAGNWSESKETRAVGPSRPPPPRPFIARPSFSARAFPKRSGELVGRLAAVRSMLVWNVTFLEWLECLRYLQTPCFVSVSSSGMGNLLNPCRAHMDPSNSTVTASANYLLWHAHLHASRVSTWQQLPDSFPGPFPSPPPNPKRPWERGWGAQSLPRAFWPFLSLWNTCMP